MLFLWITYGTTVHFSERRELVLFRRRLAHDVHDSDTAREEGITDERVVTAPGHRLGVHDRIFGKGALRKGGAFKIFFSTNC